MPRYTLVNFKKADHGEKAEKSGQLVESTRVNGLTANLLERAGNTILKVASLSTDTGFLANSLRVSLGKVFSSSRWKF